MDSLYFIIGVVAIIYFSYRLGKEQGTLSASEKAVDIMIALGYLEEKDNGEIGKKLKHD